MSDERYKLAVQNGRTFIKKGDFFKLPIPDCDIYFIWISSLLNNVYELIDRLPKGKTIIVATCKGTRDFDETSFRRTRIEQIVEYMEYIEHNYNETIPEEAKNEGFEERGTYHLHVLRKKTASGRGCEATCRGRSWHMWGM